MPQIFLDPRQISPGFTACKVPATLPQEVWDLGHLPALEQLLPGDLILVSPVSPSFKQRGIRDAQKRGGYHEDDARWTHAAVYLGFNFDICESTIEGVHIASLLDYLATCLVRIRRDKSTLGQDQRWRIAVSAASQMRRGYGFLSVVKIFFRALVGLHVRQYSGTQSPSKLTCSELYADAYCEATGRTLDWNHPGKDISPALLSFTDELVDVPVEWRKIPR